MYYKYITCVQYIRGGWVREWKSTRCSVATHQKVGHGGMNLMRIPSSRGKRADKKGYTYNTTYCMRAPLRF
jgi:hypothetical protein